METNKNILPVVLVFALLVAGGLYWYLGMQEATTEIPLEEEIQNEESANLTGNGKLSVVTDKTSYAVGDEVTLSFFMDTDVPVIGTDVIVTFNADQLELIEGFAKEDFSLKSAQVALVAGSSKKVGTPVVNYTNSVKEGNTLRYTFSALLLPGEEIQGNVPLGSITLRAKKAGNTPIDFFFEGVNVSTDSNIVYEGRDILKTVEGTTVRVES